MKRKLKQLHEAKTSRMDRSIKLNKLSSNSSMILSKALMAFHGDEAAALVMTSLSTIMKQHEETQNVID